MAEAARWTPPPAGQKELGERFFRKHAAVKERMAAVLASQHDWLPRDWLLGPLQIREGDASVHVQQAHKGEPEKFDYETPISMSVCRLPRVVVLWRMR